MPEPGVRGARATGGLVLVAIVLLAVNLRTAAVSVGPVLDDVRAGLRMPGAAAGLLTSLPVLAFALVGSSASWLARRLGPHRLIALALVCTAVGLAGRAVVGSVAGFLVLSFVALAGAAAANVVLPSLVKRHYPDRVGAMTSVYSTALAVGLTAAAVLTVPLGRLGDGWRTGLGGWAVLAVVALVPWLGLLGLDARTSDPAGTVPAAPTVSLRAASRTRLGRWMVLFFGLQSLQAYAAFGYLADIYRDAGYSASTAGILLGVLAGMSIPLSVLVPRMAARLGDVRSLVLGLGLCYPVGYLGLILAAHDGAWVWAVVLGVGGSMFPLVLTLIGLRARTPEGTAALSALAQGGGYLLAAVGPFGVGVLHDLTDGWTVPLLALSVLSLALIGAGLAVAAPAAIEDELTASG